MRTLNVTDRHWSRFTRSALFVLALIIMIGGASGGALYASADPNSSRNVPTTRPSTPQTQQPPAVPFTNLQYGFNMALLQNNTVVRSMGFQWVSYIVGWDSAEPTQGIYNWGDADNIANYARNAGVNVLIRVSRSPEWARNANCTSNPTCPPRDARLLGDFMGALAAHVRPIISPQSVAYEVWNEPNTEYEWGGICPDPEFYAAMLRAVYPRVKANDPSATVAAGAVTTVGEVRADICYMDDIVFLQRMYAAGAAPYFDVLSDHPYGFVSAPETDPLTASPPLVFRRAERHRDVMVAAGDSAKQIWATEMGWAIDPATLGSSCPRPDWYFIFSPQQQADYLVRAYQWARSYWPWMGVMFTFNFDFHEAPWYQDCDAFRFWGVKDRPAQSALAAFAHNPPATYTPAVDNPPLLRAVRYSATAFPRTGGALTIDVDASDDDNTPIGGVGANLQLPGGGTTVITFQLVAGTTRNGTWRAIYNLPANGGTGDDVYIITPYATEISPPGRTATGVPQQITVMNARFVDVPTDYWAYSFVEYLANAGVVSGYSDNTFRPGNNATRGQFSKMIVIGEGWPIDITGAPHFTDVPTTNPFYPFIETAYNRGVISGYSDNTFRPNNNITRGQIAKIVVLAEGWPLRNPPVPSFVDVPPGSAFYLFVETAVYHNIVSGYSDNTFRPNTNATRAQLSKMLFLALTQAEATATSTATAIPTETAASTPTPAETATDTPTAEPTLTGTSTPGSKAPPARP